MNTTSRHAMAAFLAAPILVSTHLAGSACSVQLHKHASRNTIPVVLVSDSDHGNHSQMKAGSARIGSIAITGAWTRQAPPASKVVGGYATITNEGDEADRLIAVNAPFAGKSEIHEMSVTDGVMRMKELADGLEIPAGGSVSLKPGSFHLMFMQATSPKEGETVPVELTFEKAGKVTVMLPVAGIGAGEAPMTDHDRMNHDG